MTGITAACKKDLDVLLTYLEKEPVVNTFFLADIEAYGFESPFQNVWIQWENSRPSAVYLRFYQNLMVYSSENQISTDFICHIAEKYDIMVIMGCGTTIQLLRHADFDSNWKYQHKKLLSLDFAPKFVPAVSGLRNAQVQDVNAIYSFLQKIEGFAAMYGSKEMLEQQLVSQEGIHLILEKDGEVVSHANSTVATRHTVMLGGVATRADMRSRGLASAVVCELSRMMLEKGLVPCVFSNAQSEHDLFRQLGYVYVDDWDMLERVQTKNETQS